MKELNYKTIQITTSAEETADVFVVPNSAGTYKDFGPFKFDFLFWAKKCLKVNGIEKSENEMEKELLVQIWFRTPEQQDAASSGIVLKNNDGETHLSRPKPYLPYSLIKDMKENDTKTILIPMTIYVNGYNEDNAEAQYPLNVEWTITARQNEYRYRNFGPFEKALDIVTREWRDKI